MGKGSRRRHAQPPDSGDPRADPPAGAIGGSARQAATPGAAAPTLWPVAAAAFALALTLRLLHIWQLRRAPFFGLLIGDAFAYDAWARSLAAGDWLGREVFYQAPLYPYLLGAWYALAGTGLVAVRLLQAVLGALGCSLVALGTARLFGRSAGLAAGLLLAAYAPAIFFDALLQKSVLDLLLVALLVLLLALLAERASRARCFWTGVTLGLLALTRENALVLLPVVLAWLYLRSRRALVPLAVAAAGVATALAPVALRNLAVGGELVVTTSQLGPNLYIGNHAGATGTYVPLRPGRGSASYERRDAVELAEVALGRALTAGEVSRYWRHRALAWIAEHPGDWTRLLGRKLLLAASHEETMDTEDLDVHADASWPLRWTASVSSFGLLVPLAALGLWWTRSRWRELWVLPASIVVYLASVVTFYVVARYRYPVVPMLAPFAGVALVELPARWRRGPRRERLLAVAIAAVAVLATRGDTGPAERQRALTHFNYGRALQTAGRSAEALAEYRLALELDPTNARAHTNLGVLSAERGEREAALGHFWAAVESAPGEARNHLNLGAELAVQGRDAEAVVSFERAVALAPGDAEARFALGTALAAGGRTPEAIDQLEAAIRLAPGDARAHNNLGILLASSGRPGEAIARFEEALRLAPDFREAAANLARARDLAVSAGPP